ncbi:MAG: hypothetical protein H6706_26255 [Myxococcales bacterium]|nr:hypothetical protein [Myxococcales bacterium]
MGDARRWLIGGAALLAFLLGALVAARWPAPVALVPALVRLRPDRLPQPPPVAVATAADPLATMDALTRLPDPPAAGTWDPVAVYRDQSRYPPTSRPLTRQQQHRVEWNRRYEAPRPLPGRPGAQWILTADRYWIIGDAPLVIELRAWDEAGPVSLPVERATVQVGEVQRTLRFQPDSEGLRAEIWPEGFGTGAVRAVVVQVAVATVEGPAEARLQAVHVRRDAVPARFTGAFQDAVDGGSLRIDVGVDVARAGRYLIDCNLYDDAGEPVAWARFKGSLPEGPGTVPLRFFGKVLVDGGRPGPWRIGELRGARHEPGAFPDLAPMEPFTAPWSTGPWPLEAFSDAPWEAPARTARLAALARFADLAPPRPGDGAAAQRFGAVGGRFQGTE